MNTVLQNILKLLQINLKPFEMPNSLYVKNWQNKNNMQLCCDDVTMILQYLLIYLL